MISLAAGLWQNTKTCNNVTSCLFPLNKPSLQTSTCQKKLIFQNLHHMLKDEQWRTPLLSKFETTMHNILTRYNVLHIAGSFNIFRIMNPLSHKVHLKTSICTVAAGNGCVVANRASTTMLIWNYIDACNRRNWISISISVYMIYV